MSSTTALAAYGMTEAQVDLIKTQIAVGCTNDELKLFMYTCNRTGLDPMARQIYAIKRNTKRGAVMTIQTGIDGYRLVADRTGKYAGSDEPQFLPEGSDRKAVVTVYKMVAGVRCPFVGVAYWSEYKPKNGGGLWDTMPRTMLAKCAEAQALRKGFPSELSGLYTKEEMDQAGGDDAPIATVSVENMEAPPLAPQEPDQQQRYEPEPPALDYTNAAGDYVVRLGKHKDKKLKDIPMGEIIGYVDWLEKSTAKSGKPLSGPAAELVAASHRYLQQAHIEPEADESAPPPNDKDFPIPF